MTGFIIHQQMYVGRQQHQQHVGHVAAGGSVAFEAYPSGLRGQDIIQVISRQILAVR